MHSVQMYRAVASGVKGGDDYRGRGCWQGPLAIWTDCRGQPKKTFRTVDGHHHESLSFARVLSLANLNIEVI